MKQFLNWLRHRFSRSPPQAGPDPGRSGSYTRQNGRLTTRRPVSAKPVQKRAPELVELDPHLHGGVADAGPGKNVLIRNKYRREDTGTHETLTILDDSLLESGEEAGIDPYNTGRFDRSKNWDKRFRK